MAGSRHSKGRVSRMLHRMSRTLSKMDRIRKCYKTKCPSCDVMRALSLRLRCRCSVEVAYGAVWDLGRIYISALHVEFYLSAQSAAQCAITTNVRHFCESRVQCGVVVSWASDNRGHKSVQLFGCMTVGLMLVRCGSPRL